MSEEKRTATLSTLDVDEYYEIVRNFDSLKIRLETLRKNSIERRKHIAEAVAEGKSTGNKISDFVFRYHNGNWDVEKTLRSIQDKMLGKKGEMTVVVTFSEIIVINLDGEYLVFKNNIVEIPAKKYCCSTDSTYVIEEAPFFSATELSEIIVGDEEIKNWLDVNFYHHNTVKNLLQKLRE